MPEGNEKLFSDMDVQVVGVTAYIMPINDDGTMVLEPHDDPLHSGAGAESLIELAGRLCYQSFHRPRPETATISGYLANIINSGHFSVLEHASVSLYVTGVSRTLTHELVRHRHLSFSQLSQRYVDGSEFKAIRPPVIDELDPSAADQVHAILADQVVSAREAYTQVKDVLRDAGITGKRASEAARAVLPGGAETSLVVTGNARAWMNFILKRDSEFADAEIREFAQKVGYRLSLVLPNIFGEKARPLWEGRAEV